MTMKQIKNIFSLNDRLFVNSLQGITEKQAKERISEHNNPLAWIATHTVWARYNCSMFLGTPAEKNPYAGMFENFKPFDESMNLPSLDEIKTEWQNATALLHKALDNATEAHLQATSPIKNPTGDFTNAGTAAFLAQHESYSIGQMAFLKKYYTKEAMKY